MEFFWFPWCCCCVDWCEFKNPLYNVAVGKLNRDTVELIHGFIEIIPAHALDTTIDLEPCTDDIFTGVAVVECERTFPVSCECNFLVFDRAYVVSCDMVSSVFGITIVFLFLVLVFLVLLYYCVLIMLLALLRCSRWYVLLWLYNYSRIIIVSYWILSLALIKCGCSSQIQYIRSNELIIIIISIARGDW